jgi:5-methylcytosine-specific restriction endonuclease McrA
MPLQDLPPGSAGGDNAGKRFSPAARRRYPEGTPCMYCGQRTTNQPGLPNSLEGEHVIPSSRGGNTDPENMGPACRTCNRQKGARTPEEWYRWLLQKLGLGE